MKKLTTSILLALFSATIFTPTHVEASWLSKTWEKIEKSWNESGTHTTVTETSSPSERAMYLPQRSEYPSSYSPGQFVGQRPDVQDLIIAGVPVGAQYSEIRRALGTPTAEKMYTPGMVFGGSNIFMRYGGITYESVHGGFDRAGLITVVNRDAVTHRGIAVGDSLEAVYQAYGRPTHINSRNDWFYGAFIWASDAKSGITFENDGEKVTKIRVINS